MRLGLVLLAGLMAFPAVGQDRNPFGSRSGKNKKGDKKAGNPDPKPPTRDPLRGLRYAENYRKALEYIQKEYKNVGYGTVPALMAGFVFLVDGREEYKDELEDVIRIAMKNFRNEKAFNANWFVAYCGLFLSILYLRDPREDVRSALEELIEVAKRTQETTGGWCHHKEMWKENNYHKIGGGKDLGMVTATMLSAFLIMKQGGIDVPQPLINSAHQNLLSISRGSGISYGTNNPAPDRAMSRIASAYIGLHVARWTSSPLYSKALSGVPAGVPRLENGHAYGPVHFFAVSVAMKLMGRYHEVADYWLPKLAQRQKSDGTVEMKNDSKANGEQRFTRTGVGATAVYALMILLQKYDLIQPGPGRHPAAKGRGRRKHRGGPSPFRRRKD